MGAADSILLNKLDGMDAAARACVEAAMRAANPLADVCAIEPATLDPVVLLGPWREEAARPLPAVPSAFGGHPRPEGGLRAMHAPVQSFTVRLDAPLDHDRLRDALSFLILRHADRLLRCKGVIRMAGAPRPILLQGVQDVFNTGPAPDHVLLPEGDYGAIVFIGLDLPEAAIRTDLARCAVRPA